MTAHISFPAFDPSGLPATLSHPVLTGLLRQRMGFDGLIVTDAMDMHAIAKRFQPGEASVLAILAGADLVLTTEPEICFDALHDAALSGRISVERLDASVNRILAAKEQLGLFAERMVDASRAGDICSDPAHRAVARRIAETAFTTISGSLERPNDVPWLLLVPDYRRSTGTSFLQDIARRLREGALPNARLLQISRNPTPGEIDGILGERGNAEGATLLTASIVRLYDPPGIHAIDGEVALVERLSVHLPVSVIGFGCPYILPAFHAASAIGCAYGADAESVSIALEVLAGRIEPRGRMPVELPGL